MLRALCAQFITMKIHYQQLGLVQHTGGPSGLLLARSITGPPAAVPCCPWAASQGLQGHVLPSRQWLGGSGARGLCAIANNTGQETYPSPASTAAGPAAMPTAQQAPTPTPAAPGQYQAPLFRRRARRSMISQPPMVRVVQPSQGVGPQGPPVGSPPQPGWSGPAVGPGTAAAEEQGLSRAGVPHTGAGPSHMAPAANHSGTAAVVQHAPPLTTRGVFATGWPTGAPMAEHAPPAAPAAAAAAAASKPPASFAKPSAAARSHSRFPLVPQGRSTGGKAAKPQLASQPVAAADTWPSLPPVKWRPIRQWPGLNLPPVLWSLPGMAEGQRPASAKELLDAVAKLLPDSFAQVAHALPVLLAFSTAHGPKRTFLFDTETTASYPATYHRFRICDVCLVEHATGDTFSTLVNPGGKMTTSSLAVHGITDSMVADAPSTSVTSVALLLWVWQRCEAAGGSTVTLTAHNASFDSSVLAHTLSDASIALPMGWQTCCTHQLVRRLKAEGLAFGEDGLRLVQCARWLGLEVPPVLHRAEADVMLMRDVMDELMRRFWPGLTLDQAVDRNFNYSSKNAAGKLSELPVKPDFVTSARSARQGLLFDLYRQRRETQQLQEAHEAMEDARLAVVRQVTSKEGTRQPFTQPVFESRSKAEPKVEPKVQPKAHPELSNAAALPLRTASRTTRIAAARTTRLTQSDMLPPLSVQPDAHPLGAAVGHPGADFVLAWSADADAVGAHSAQPGGAAPLGGLQDKAALQPTVHEPHETSDAQAAVHTKAKAATAPAPAKGAAQPAVVIDLTGGVAAGAERSKSTRAAAATASSRTPVEPRLPAAFTDTVDSIVAMARGHSGAGQLHPSEVSPVSAAAQASSIAAPGSSPAAPARTRRRVKQDGQGVTLSDPLPALHGGLQPDQPSRDSGSSSGDEPQKQAVGAAAPQSYADVSGQWSGAASGAAGYGEALSSVAQGPGTGPPPPSDSSDEDSKAPARRKPGRRTAKEIAAAKAAAAAEKAAAEASSVQPLLATLAGLNSTAVAGGTGASSKAAKGTELTASLLPTSPESQAGVQLWSILTQPLDSKPLDKHFTEKQAADLQAGGISCLLDLLMWHPRIYKPFSYTIQPGLPEQPVAVMVRVSGAPNAFKPNASIAMLKVPLEVVQGVNQHPVQGSHPAARGGRQYIEMIAFAFGGHWGLMQLRARGAELVKEPGPMLLLGTLMAKGGSWECKNAQLVSAGDSGAWVRQLVGLEPRDDPDTQGVDDGPRDLGLLPVYKARTPLASKDFLGPENKLKGLMQRAITALTSLPGGHTSLAGLPSQIMPELLPLYQALLGVHMPTSVAHRDLARQSLAYHELVFLQLRLMQRRHAFLTSNSDKQACHPVSERSACEAARAALPFQLTPDQERVLGEVLEDMDRPLAMFRLLQGDVGSGKTVVALLAMMAAAGSGSQALLLAPTEILAQQHHRTLTNLVDKLPARARNKLLGPTRTPPALLSGSSKGSERTAIASGLQSGACRLVVSTHAAFWTQGWVRLGLVVIDEQHKFGLAQKQRLLELCPAVHPHILSMSATPIPRTLALALYGDMEVSVIQGRPPGRLPVATQTVVDDEGGRDLMVEAIIKEVASGGRAFVVYPGKGTHVDEESDEEDEEGKPKKKKKAKGKAKAAAKKPKKAKAAGKGSKAKKAAAGQSDWSDESDVYEEGEEDDMGEEEVQAIKTATADFMRFTQDNVFGEHKCVLLHGGMKPEAKEGAIASHRAGSHPIMICTSVVEVGVDVAEASIMVVQQADRFGLAQLHQMRGRVGRSSRPSMCLLMTASDSPEAQKRLQTLESCHDGLEIAESDLIFRGAGSLFSSTAKQSGTPDCSPLCSTELLRNPRLVLAAREAAAAAHASGPDPVLQAVVDAFARGGSKAQQQQQGAEAPGRAPLGEAH